MFLRDSYGARPLRSSHTHRCLCCYGQVAIHLCRKLIVHDRAYSPTPFNMHRLLIATLTVAAKAHHDNIWGNDVMAFCGGIRLDELNKLERHLCTCLRWRLLPTAGDLLEIDLALPNPKAAYWEAWSNR